MKSYIFSVFSILLAFFCSIFTIFLFLSYFPVGIFPQYIPIHQEVISLLSGNTSVLTLLNQNEIAHILDVRELLLLCLGITLVIFFLSFIFSKYSKRKNDLRNKALFFLILIFLICIIPFDTFFLSFHTLLFPQGNWSFPIDSLLIQTYPESFWMRASLIWLLLAASFSFLFNLFTIKK